SDTLQMISRWVFNSGNKPSYVLRIYREALSRFSCAASYKTLLFPKTIIRNLLFLQKGGHTIE
ncbi:hypothetical protein AAHB56_18035, partial [Bacillus thuringiensis]